jgi:nitronate monooxygenase
MAVHAPASLRLDVIGDDPKAPTLLHFDPAQFGATARKLTRPAFLAIVSAHSLAANLLKKASGKVDGFIIEGWTAGGHNAPPRGALKLNDRGEPEYGERDVVDLQAMRDLGAPFWLAGGVGSPEGLREARAQGAQGIQVGTAFAFSDESGLDPAIKAQVLRGVANGTVDVYTDPVASPTGFPFKIVRTEGLVQQDDSRERCCDLGYLRSAYRREDGKVRFRCSAEPVHTYLASGGKEEDTVGRRCLCNGLMSVIGLPQAREDGGVEPPVLTSGDCVKELAPYAAGASYRAGDVVDHLLSGLA